MSTKRKSRKKNPSRIPISKSEFNIVDIAMQATSDHIYCGWILLFSAIHQNSMELSYDRILEIWNTINNLNATQDGSSRTIEELDSDKKLGWYLPHPHLSGSNIRSKFALEAFKRKVRRNTLYTSLGILCISLRHVPGFTVEDSCKIYTSMQCMEAEILHGLTTYDELHKELIETYHIGLKKADGPEGCSLVSFLEE